MRGETPADVVLTGGRVINVFTGEIETIDIALCGQTIAGLGSGYKAKQTIELAGAYVAPDSSTHMFT